MIFKGYADSNQTQSYTLIFSSVSLTCWVPPYHLYSCQGLSSSPWAAPLSGALSRLPACRARTARPWVALTVTVASPCPGHCISAPMKTFLSEVAAIVRVFVLVTAMQYRDTYRHSSVKALVCLRQPYRKRLNFEGLWYKIQNRRHNIEFFTVFGLIHLTMWRKGLIFWSMWYRIQESTRHCFFVYRFWSTSSYHMEQSTWYLGHMLQGTGRNTYHRSWKRMKDMRNRERGVQ